jgi:small subunit ribosomal protein S24
MIILSGLVTRTTHPRRMYFLIGYTEEILSTLLKTPVKMEIQTIDNKDDVIFTYW